MLIDNKPKQRRGYFGIGVQNIKRECNLGTLYRSAYNFGAAFIFNIGNRYKKQTSDTTQSFKHIPFYEYKTIEEFLENTPLDCQKIAVEINERAKCLTNFTHPERAVYILGPEDGSISPVLLDKCQFIVKIESRQCLNLSVAGACVMFDRCSKNNRK